MRKLVPLVFISMFVASAASCSLFVDLDGLDNGSDASTIGPSCDSGSCDETILTSDAASDANAPQDGGSDAGINPCLAGNGTAGPRMIQADGYCIDATEVTVSQYFAFLDVDASVTQPVECAWNNSFAPSTDQRNDARCTSSNVDPGTRAQHPISCVDWCDAWSYCEWAGKRLCGAISGGAVNYNSYNVNGQWYGACASAANDTWPNDSDDGGNCWLGQAGSVPVDSVGCNGGYPGLTDMVGNVEEWIDSCNNQGEIQADSGGPGFDYCHDEGDEFDENFSGKGCGANDIDNRNETWAGIGFRCCSK